LSKIIEVRGLSKSYIINHEGKENYNSLRDVITDKTKKIFSFSNWKSTHKTQEEFWALKDVDFDIEQGDRVGIIGRNGAGKSTLLKILSRITEPTKGTIKLKGRIASLLEVGTGFHPELTGKENIYLNGAILGMSRAEIKKHFDAIIDFAEVEKFLDTPVKRYSSGMYVRLAFAVAAHLEPEILIVDEVLAVGDAQFQKKCLGKMEDVSKNEGRTVLFVSHNMGAVQRLCTQLMVLNMGTVGFQGEVALGLKYYDSLVRDQNLINISSGFKLKIDIKVNGYLNPETVESEDAIEFIIEVNSPEDYQNNFINVCIDNSEGEHVIHLRNDFEDFNVNIHKGLNKFNVGIQKNLLAPGMYYYWFRLVIGNHQFIIDTDLISLYVKGNLSSGLIAHKSKWIENHSS
jgi:lipopolysaccharide transport system ATP-binding protein